MEALLPFPAKVLMIPPKEIYSKCHSFAETATLFIIFITW